MEDAAQPKGRRRLAGHGRVGRLGAAQEPDDTDNAAEIATGGIDECDHDSMMPLVRFLPWYRDKSCCELCSDLRQDVLASAAAGVAGVESRSPAWKIFIKTPKSINSIPARQNKQPAAAVWDSLSIQNCVYFCLLNFFSFRVESSPVVASRQPSCSSRPCCNDRRHHAPAHLSSHACAARLHPRSVGASLGDGHLLPHYPDLPRK